jgi:hypothetical protein
MIAAFVAVAIICLSATVLSLKVGLTRMEGFEF